jgi:tRNA uridine 5-carboxymethylaminomethyl modification enzyme
MAALAEARALAERLSATPDELLRHGFKINRDGQRRNVMDLLRYAEIDLPELRKLWPDLAAWTPEIEAQIEIDAVYAGYLARQEADIAAFRRDENLKLPAELDYSGIPSLSNEVQEKLAAARPATLGAAARIPGVTPAALVALLRHVKRRDLAA